MQALNRALGLTYEVAFEIAPVSCVIKDVNTHETRKDTTRQAGWMKDPARRWKKGLQRMPGGFRPASGAGRALGKERNDGAFDFYGAFPR